MQVFYEIEGSPKDYTDWCPHYAHDIPHWWSKKTDAVKELNKLRSKFKDYRWRLVKEVTKRTVVKGA